MWRVRAAAGLLFLSGCAGLSPREPTALSNGMLIARARVRGALLGFTSDLADSATLEQLGPDGQPVPGKEAVAGVSDEVQAYFLDLPPGRYALTSISFRARGARYRVLVPPALGRKEAVDLRPGTAAFMGEFDLDGRFPDFDVAVERALSLIGHWLTPWMRRPVIARDADPRGVGRGVEAEARALRAARATLGATQWRQAIEARLRELHAPEPVKTQGAIRPKEIALRPEAFLSWRDTLEWGPPKHSADALTWSKPGGTARIAVFFTSATARGFAGFEAAVREMRAAASTMNVSDQGELYEVRVSTRVGAAARVRNYHYPVETLVGSKTEIIVTETVLVPDRAGMYTARLRAAQGEFEKVLPAFREWLLQLVLGPPEKSEDRRDSFFLPL